MATILQSLLIIEKVIYTISYDDLDDYLKGVRDVINLLNGEENAEEIKNYIINELYQRSVSNDK